MISGMFRMPEALPSFCTTVAYAAAFVLLFVRKWYYVQSHTSAFVVLMNEAPKPSDKKLILHTIIRDIAQFLVSVHVSSMVTQCDILAKCWIESWSHCMID